MKTIDGAPDAVKVACPVLIGGKAGDCIKGLPIETIGKGFIKCLYLLCKGFLPKRVSKF